MVRVACCVLRGACGWLIGATNSNPPVDDTQHAARSTQHPAGTPSQPSGAPTRPGTLMQHRKEVAMTPRAPGGRIVRIALDAESAETLYRQVYRAIRAAILEGRLGPRTRLPSTRGLARDLGVSRSTVVQAYEQLRAEGYVDGRIGSGTRVSAMVPDSLLRLHDARGARPAPPALSSGAGGTAGGTAGVAAGAFAGRPSARGEALAAVPRRLLDVRWLAPRAFRGGVPAVDVFPVEIWGRLMARRWRLTPPRLLSYGDPFGHPPLRAAVAEYLNAARGVRCTPEQVLITAGSQQALDLCARTLLDPGDRAWVEDPGYLGARGAIVAAGAQPVPVPVDAEGLDVAAGRERCPRARLAFVTPSRQLPLGMTMSASRRLALLEWAARAGAWVIEDDYDSEFRYASRPLAALQGLDPHGCVLYVGTFSKVMFPSLRLGYLVVPPRLAEAFAAARHFADYCPPYLEQAVMSDFITEGHFERHIRRMRTIYRER